MELARIVADAVPQEAPAAPPPRRPPVLIAPRRPVTPNMRPLPSERAAAAARAAAEAAAAPAPVAPDEAAPGAPGHPQPDVAGTSGDAVGEETAAVSRVVSAGDAEMVPPGADAAPDPEPQPQPEPEIDEFEKALSAELGVAPLRPEAAPAGTGVRGRPASGSAAPRQTAEAAPRPPAAVAPEQPEDREETGQATASDEATPRPATPPRPTVEDLAAALSLELDLPGDAAADAAPAARSETPRDAVAAPAAEPPRPSVKSAANVWLAELPALELPPPEEPADAEAAAEVSAVDERARRQAEREQRREQRRAAKAQRRGEDGDEETPPPAADVVTGALAATGAAAVTAATGARAAPASPGPDRGAAPGAASGARTAGAGRTAPAEPAVPVPPAAAVPPATARPGAPPFDFAAFEAEIRSSLDEGPLPDPARPAAPRMTDAPRAADAPRGADVPRAAATPQAPEMPPPVKPAMPKPVGLAPMAVPGRPGETAAPSPAEVAPVAAPRPPRAVEPQDQDLDLDLLESEPGHSDETVLPPHSDAEQRALRSTIRSRRRAPVVAVAAAAAVVLLAGGATAWWLLSGTTEDGPPPLIQAETDPVKVDPPVSEARDAGEPGKAFTDRVGEAGDPARQVLDPEGRQTIDLPIAGRVAGDPSLPGVDTDDPLAQLAADPNEPMGTVAPTPPVELQPKRVRTVVVRPDGTIVPQQDLPTLVTPEPQAPPQAGLAPSEPTTSFATGAVDPAVDVTASPALEPVPTLEPLPAEAESLAGAIGYPMPRRKPLVFDEPNEARTVPRPTSNLPDPLPAEGASAVPVFGSTQGVNTGPVAPSPSATDAAAAALADGPAAAEPVAAPATVPAPVADAVPAAPAAPVETATDAADTRAVTTTPVRVATLPPARQDPPPPVPAAEPPPGEAPLSLPSATPAPSAAAPSATAPSAPAAQAAAGRSARLLPPAGNGSNPFAPAAPAPQAAAPAPAEPVAPAEPAPVAAAPAVATTAGGAYVVQLASQKSDAEARAAYASLQRRFPSILGGLSPVIQTADVGTRGTFYRVRLPFGSATDANRLCNELKAAGGDCFVGRN